MRLATFTDDKGTRIGVVQGTKLLDLAEARPDLPCTMRGLLTAGEKAMAAARDAAGQYPATIDLARVRLEAPVPDPQKFFAIALNYHLRDVLPPDMGEDEAAEIRAKQASMYADGRQMWYNKQVTCISGPYDGIPTPPDADEVYFEAELAFVVGKTCRNVTREQAPNFIAGYMVSNDVTEGAWCRGSPTLTFGKSFDGFGPMGPWLVTADEIADPHALNIVGTVNGEVQQAGNTRDLIFDCHELVAFASRRCTLHPGDIVTTGMPYCKLQRLSPGDIVRCEIEGIGHIEQQVHGHAA